MVFSPLSSTSYHRSLSPVAEGQHRRDGQSGRLFILQQPKVANDEATDTSLQQVQSAEKSQAVVQNSLEKWLRLTGAARQMAYEGERQPETQGTVGSMRYRVQRTYFDQERQASPQSPTAPDHRLMAYRAADGHEQGARAIDFVV